MELRGPNADVCCVGTSHNHSILHYSCSKFWLPSNRHRFQRKTIGGGGGIVPNHNNSCPWHCEQQRILTLPCKPSGLSPCVPDVTTRVQISRLPPLYLSYYKQSKTGGRNGLGMGLEAMTASCPGVLTPHVQVHH